MNKTREEVLEKLLGQIDVRYFLTPDEFKVLRGAMVTPPVPVKKVKKS